MPLNSKNKRASATFKKGKNRWKWVGISNYSILVRVMDLKQGDTNLCQAPWLNLQGQPYMQGSLIDFAISTQLNLSSQGCCGHSRGGEAHMPPSAAQWDKK